jgi:CRP-like cAMP-binding protein
MGNNIQSAGNRLLATLPEDDYNRLVPHLQPLDFGVEHVFYEPGAHIEYVYFLNSGLASVTTLMEDGHALEVGTIGREGMAGLSILMGVNTTPNHCLAQAQGHAWRMKADMLKEETRGDTPLRRVLSLYQYAFVTQIMQGAACNSLHSNEQRCCRWLLMCQDRVQREALELTHEFLSHMLGVRRASVTDILHPPFKRQD